MNYFAYGSNMNSAYLHEYCPSATYLMRASLPNYRIEFRRFSTDLQGGISTIIETPGELVHGVLFDIEPAELDALDILEDVPQGLYKRETFRVLGEGGSWHLAELYRVAQPSGPYQPAKKYVEWMIEGAREHKLNKAYIAKLVDLLESID